ncbi:MAG: BlaI/MecI/CopY family transcriptional regulator [Oscillospiraceae bacterium]|nr:BlaI/MecI/CopY family transcriptional regulator [Clostridiales bacterium]MDO4877579.1 BlaI/MecI/CopY family transcriptional regulator [Oscillospiraceae bacterium]
MSELSLFESEKRLMEIIWREAPVESGRLVKLALENNNWNKSTTYTILRKLIAKGFVKNENSIVSVLIPKEKVLVSESRQIVEDSFSGSLPMFVASFLGQKKTLSDEDADALIKLIKEHTEDDKK